MLPINYPIMTWSILIILIVSLLIALAALVLIIKNQKRLDRLEKEVFNLLKGLDDKNYRLWKTKLKLEELLKKHHKTI